MIECLARFRAAAPYALLICLVAGVSLLPSCRPAPKGPPLVVMIVDRTASTSSFSGQLQSYAAAAIAEYAKQGKMHIVLINLDESPSMDIEKTGELTNDEIDEINGYIKQVDYQAKGTDIVGAFDKACEYYGYERVPPRVFRVLCFTDGLAESATSRKFRQWSDLDATKLKEANAQVAVYFVSSQVRGQVESALSGMNAKIKETSQAKGEAEKETFDLPGVLQ